MHGKDSFDLIEIMCMGYESSALSLWSEEKQLLAVAAPKGNLHFQYWDDLSRKR
jgi:hypothetical protein